LLLRAGGLAPMGGRCCCNRRPTAGTLATKGRWPCSNEQPTLLQSRTDDGRTCYQCRTAGVAAIGDRRRADLLTRESTFLRWATNVASKSGRRCYLDMVALLPAATDVVTKAHQACYHGLQALLQALSKMLPHREVHRRQPLPAKERRRRSHVGEAGR
jgi:hypothetical protein